MYSLVLLALLGSGFCLPTGEIEKNVNYQHYVLPRESFPTLYDVRLFLNPDNTENFFGNVSIRIIPANYTDEIVLQAMEMDINKIEVYSDRNNTEDLFQSFTQATDDTHFLRIKMNSELFPLQPYVVHIDYVSRFAENMFGVYVSTYEEPGVGRVNLITSQLQPTFARRAFPCYDEPSHKAIFRTTIYAPPAYPVVRSNMPERGSNETLKPNVPGWVKFEFQDTLVMSSYLLAYLVSKFQYITNEGGQNPLYHIPFRVYSRPGTQNTAAFALDFGQRNMGALEKYYDFPYEFPKIDKAAVPDFAAGAMENWGLVIYREIALLVREGITTTAVRQNIGRIICHENVHMWFGNEVSPVSWTYTWLNEGFANFFENYGTDLVQPDWRMMDQFVLLLQNVMQSDAVLSVNPMTHPVFTPSQVIGTFNAVAYQKSGSVLRMVQHFMTPEIFVRGLQIYLRDNMRTSVTPPALYKSLQEALDASNHSIPWPIATIMDRWTNQGGFPVLTVRRSAPNAESFFVSQERFLTDRTLISSDRWHVPINWVLSTNPDFSNTSPQAWIPISFPAVSIDVPGFANASWFIINKQQTGYYRVNYETENWRALANVLSTNHNTIHVLNRAQIIDDSFNLARNARLNYNVAFDLSRYLRDEQDYIPWGAINAAFGYLDVVLSGSPAYLLFQTYVLHLSAPLYERLGFEAQPGEEHVTAYHRNIALDLNCRLGNADCVSRAQTLLEQFRNNTISSLNPDIQTIVYCSGLRGGSVDNFNFLWEQYLASSDSSEQSILLNALGCTSNTQLRDFYLNQVINETSAVRDQDRHTVVVSVINSSPAGMEAALEFVIENFHLIQPRVQGLTGTTNILNAFARRLTTKQHSSRIDTFVARHQGIFTAGEQASVAAIRENIAASITWTSDNYDTVHSWLTATFGSNGNVVTSSFLIVLSFIVTIYNY